MVHNFGEIHPSTHVTDHSFILRFIHTDLHNTFVTFRIDASDIVFVYNVAKGRIVDAYATKFAAVKEVGKLYVEVENTGQLESEFSVVLSECLGRQSTPSKVVRITPGRIANVSFSLQSYKTKGESSLCEGTPCTDKHNIPAHIIVTLFSHTVQLFDKSFNFLGSSKVGVNVEGACFCFGECGCTVSTITIIVCEVDQASDEILFTSSVDLGPLVQLAIVQHCLVQHRHLSWSPRGILQWTYSF